MDRILCIPERTEITAENIMTVNRDVACHVVFYVSAPSCKSVYDCGTFRTVRKIAVIEFYEITHLLCNYCGACAVYDVAAFARIMILPVVLQGLEETFLF